MTINVNHRIDCGIRQHNIGQRTSSSSLLAAHLQVAKSLTV